MKLFGVRIARPCYDKFWRCPGWAGPGWKRNKQDGNWCENGGGSYGAIDWDERWKLLGRELYAPRWRSWRCPECSTLVLPSQIRYIDPRHWRYAIPWWIKDKIQDWRYNRQCRR